MIGAHAVAPLGDEAVFTFSDYLCKSGICDFIKFFHAGFIRATVKVERRGIVGLNVPTQRVTACIQTDTCKNAFCSLTGQTFRGRTVI